MPGQGGVGTGDRRAVTRAVGIGARTSVGKAVGIDAGAYVRISVGTGWCLEDLGISVRTDGQVSGECEERWLYLS